MSTKQYTQELITRKHFIKVSYFFKIQFLVYFSPTSIEKVGFIRHLIVRCWVNVRLDVMWLKLLSKQIYYSSFFSPAVLMHSGVAVYEQIRFSMQVGFHNENSSSDSVRRPLKVSLTKFCLALLGRLTKALLTSFNILYP